MLPLSEHPFKQDLVRFVQKNSGKIRNHSGTISERIVKAHGCVGLLVTAMIHWCLGHGPQPEKTLDECALSEETILQLSHHLDV